MSKVVNKGIENHKLEDRKYGLSSMIALIVGVVIGAGSFVKNPGVMRQTDSTAAGMIGWIVAAFMVICMTISFVEVASISRRAKKTGSIATWGEMLIGKNFGKFIGFNFMFLYMPIIIGVLAIYASNEIASAAYVGSKGNIEFTDWNHFWLTSGIGIFFILFFFISNILSNKFGKNFQRIAVITLLASHLTVIGYMIAAGVSDHAPEAVNIWDFDQVWNAGISSSAEAGNGFFQPAEGPRDLFSLVIVTMPALMFAFDGFLISSSLQSEAKTDRTYKAALTLGTIIFVAFEIALVYGMFQFGAAAAVEAQANNSVVDSQLFGITGVLTYLFGTHAYWATPLLIVTILFSMLSSLSGILISGTRYMSSMSDQDQIVDKTGAHLRRNRAGTPVKGALTLFWFTMVWFILLRGLDAVTLHQLIKDDVTGNVFTAHTFDFAADISALLNYVIYAIIMIGAMNNRTTGKLESDRVNGFLFWPASIIGSIIPLMVGLNTTTVEFAKPFRGMAQESQTHFEFASNIINAVLVVIVAFFSIIAVAISNNIIRKTDKKVFRDKKPMKAYYHTGATHPLYGGDEKYYNKFFKGNTKNSSSWKRKE